MLIDIDEMTIRKIKITILSNKYEFSDFKDKGVDYLATLRQGCLYGMLDVLNMLGIKEAIMGKWLNMLFY